MAAFLIAFTASFDEYAVASFVVGTDPTFPIYLYGALRFPSRLPQVIAVAVVVMIVSLLVVVAAELGRRLAERRLGGPRGLGKDVWSACHESTDTHSGLERAARGDSSARRCETTVPIAVSTRNCVYIPRKTTSAIVPSTRETSVGTSAPTGAISTRSGAGDAQRRAGGHTRLDRDDHPAPLAVGRATAKPRRARRR